MRLIDTERAERLSAVRAAVAIVLGTALAATHTQRMDAGGCGSAMWLVTGVIVVVSCFGPADCSGTRRCAAS